MLFLSLTSHTVISVHACSWFYNGDLTLSYVEDDPGRSDMAPGCLHSLVLPAAMALGAAPSRGGDRHFLGPGALSWAILEMDRSSHVPSGKS